MENSEVAMLEPEDRKPIVEMDDAYIQRLVCSDAEYDSEEDRPDTENIHQFFDSDADEIDEMTASDDDDARALFAPGEDMGETLGDEWLYDNKNHVYFNTITKETLVRKTESNTLYEQRRAQRALDAMIMQDFPAPEGIPVMKYDPNLTEAIMHYTPAQMEKIRRKYHWLDYDELNKYLKQADRDFFQKTQNPNLLPWEPDVPAPVNDDDEQQDRHFEEMEKFNSKIQHIYQVASFRRVNQTAKGRVFSVGSLMIGGNGRGWAGYGYGKGAANSDAERRALVQLRNNLVDVPLLEGRTIFTDVVGKYGRTKVLMKRRPRGFGLRGGTFMKCLAESLGILDMSSKIIGRRHPLHVAYAAFEGLGRMRSTRELALMRGVNYYRMFEAGTEHEKSPTQDELDDRAKIIQEYIKQAQRDSDHRNLTLERLKETGRHETTRFRGKGRRWHMDQFLPGQDQPPGKKGIQEKWLGEAP